MEDIIFQPKFEQLCSMTLSRPEQIQQIQPFQVILMSKPKGGIIKWLRDHIRKIHVPFFLMTHGGVPALPDTFITLFRENRYLLGWASKNCTHPNYPKCFSLPLGMKPITYEKKIYDKYYIKDFSNYEETREIYFKSKPNFLHTRMNANSSQFRRNAAKMLLANKWDVINCGGKGGREKKRVPPITFIDELTKSKFVASPRGFNIDCYRHWETLYSGSILVAEKDIITPLLEDLPVIFVVNWSQVTSAFLNKEYEKLKEKTFNFEKLSMAYYVNKFEGWKQGLIDGFKSEYKDLILSNPSPISLPPKYKAKKPKIFKPKPIPKPKIVATKGSNIVVIVGLGLGREIPTYLKDKNTIIYGFEPHSESYNTMISKYKKEGRVEIYNNAISNEDISKPFYECKYAGTSSLGDFVDQKSIDKWNHLDPTKIPISKSIKNYSIACTRLDTFMISHKIDYINHLQISAQGHDYNVLLSLGDMIKKVHKISVVIFLIDYKLYCDQNPAEDFYKFFKDHNFIQDSVKYGSKHKKFMTATYINKLFK
jgi:FkbM family methyltransferase